MRVSKGIRFAAGVMGFIASATLTDVAQAQDKISCVYYGNDSDKRSYADAKAFCESKDKTLPIITSIADQRIMAKLITDSGANGDFMYLGLRLPDDKQFVAGSADGWNWEGGSSGFDAWGDNEPADADERCAVMRAFAVGGTSSGEWEGSRCDFATVFSCCERVPCLPEESCAVVSTFEGGLGAALAAVGVAGLAVVFLKMRQRRLKKLRAQGVIPANTSMFSRVSNMFSMRSAAAPSQSGTSMGYASQSGSSMGYGSQSQSRYTGASKGSQSYYGAGSQSYGGGSQSYGYGTGSRNTAASGMSGMSGASGSSSRRSYNPFASYRSGRSQASYTSGRSGFSSRN